MAEERINLGIIGCGGFVRGVHVPNIMRNPRYRIRAAMDINGEAAEKLGAETGAEYHTDDLDRVLEDGAVNAVIITTRHDSHAELSVRAAEAGKHLLCEKPMGLSMEECREVASAVRKNGVVYTVGYNRGLAPMISMARELLSGEEAKKLIYHRMQAGLSPEHWLLDPAVGGGRITGEGCHIFDLFCEITGKPPVSVYAAGGSFVPGSRDENDSSLVTVAFSDGSAATVLLMSAGCPAFPKEATEVYCGGKAIFINDFSRMEYYGFEGRNSVKTVIDPQDKGHREELELFAEAILSGAPAPNSIEKGARAAAIGFAAMESIRSGRVIGLREKDYSV